MIWSIHTMDCIAGMDHVKKGTVDVCVTSPPYNLGIKYKNYSDDIARRDYLKWCRIWLCKVCDLMKPDGSLFLNLGSCPKNPMLPHELILEATSIFSLQNTFHWIKAISIERFPVVNSYGHFQIWWTHLSGSIPRRNTFKKPRKE